MSFLMHGMKGQLSAHDTEGMHFLSSVTDVVVAHDNEDQLMILFKMSYTARSPLRKHNI